MTTRTTCQGEREPIRFAASAETIRRYAPTARVAFLEYHHMPDGTIRVALNADGVLTWEDEA